MKNIKKFALRMPDDDHEKAKKAAQSANRSVNQWICLIIRDAVKHIK